MDKLIGLFIGRFLEWLSGFLWRPVLNIEFKATQEPYVNFDLEGSGTPTAYYRALVRNTGRKRAENCEGFLVSIERYDLRQRASRDLLGRPERLKWAHEADFRNVQIESGGETRKLDLFYVHKDEPNLLHLFIQRQRIPDRYAHVDRGWVVRIQNTNNM